MYDEQRLYIAGFNDVLSKELNGQKVCVANSNRLEKLINCVLFASHAFYFIIDNDCWLQQYMYIIILVHLYGGK